MNMREELRQYDIQCGINYQRALMKAAAEKMVQKGEMTQEQAEELLTRIEEIKKL